MPTTRPRPPTLRRLTPLLVVLSAIGCASPPAPTIYLHPNADLAVFRKVAVLPLENLTSDRFAADRTREILTVELLAGGVFEPLEVGEVNRVLRVQNLAALTDLGPEEVAKLGKALGVQALVMGSVMDSTERRVGTLTAPQVALSLKMIDVQTGTTVWSVVDARTGLSTTTRLFGVGEETSSQAVRELVRQLLDELLRTAGYE
jgi:TolB-like protein